MLLEFRGAWNKLTLRYFLVSQRRSDHLKPISKDRAFHRLFGEARHQDQQQHTTPVRVIPTYVKYLVWDRDQGKCVLYHDRNILEFDHINPASRGGADSFNNIRLLCRSCNWKKSNNLFYPLPATGLGDPQLPPASKKDGKDG